MKGLQTSLTTIALLFCVTAAIDSAADAGQVDELKTKNVKVSILIRGAHCEEDVAALRESLKKRKGIKFDAEAITVGEKPKYSTEPFKVTIADTEKTNIGALAAVVSKAKTPHRKEFPPKVNLVLYTPERIDEEQVIALRSELMDVNGVEVLEPGGLGGVPDGRYYWIQLEDAGGATLREILQAVEESRVPVTLQKP